MKDVFVSGSEDEEYAMTMRRSKSSYWRMSKATERQEPKEALSSLWSIAVEEDDEKVKDETCLVLKCINVRYVPAIILLISDEKLIN
ncbi:hypothetical protein Tco_0174388 [Tanacetum coccineum]